MMEQYLLLPKKEQAQILNTVATSERLKKSPQILQKDIWLCWALDTLFQMPGRLPMAFKGGTSLSKVYNAIQRFSEDIDITINYKAFATEDPFEKSVSRSKIKKISDQIKALVTHHIKTMIIPHFENEIKKQFNKSMPTVELDEDGETLHVHYPSALEQESEYLLDSIKLEFGGRNLTTPNNIITITTDICDHMNNLHFPSAKVTVLSPEKTFWEKITLIHAECNREDPRHNANRISRHWYDIAKLSNHDIGKKAIEQTDILKDVIKLKKTFYHTSHANYDNCITGKLQLIPNKNCLEALEEDFNKMLAEKMFYDAEPVFNKIIEQISELEKTINSRNFQP